MLAEMPRRRQRNFTESDHPEDVVALVKQWQADSRGVPVLRF